MRNQPTIRAGPASRLVLLALLSVILPLNGKAMASASPAGTRVVNVASLGYLSGATTTTVLSNQVVTLVGTVPGLAVTKSVEPTGAVPPGSMVTFRFLVENPASVPVDNVVLTDLLDPLLGPPALVTNGPVTDKVHGGTVPVIGAYVAASRSIRWDIAAIPAGARFQLSFAAQISPAAPDDTIVRNVSTQVSVQDPAGTSSNLVLVPVVAPALSISMQASRSRAEVGEPVGFTIDVTNISATLDLRAAQIRGLLPRGFRYLEGSSRLDGKKIPDPSLAAGAAGGRQLLFSIGALAMAEAHHLTYVAVPTPEADKHDGLSKAWADAVTPAGSSVTAGPAEALVRVAGSLLTSEAVVVGRVFVDDNRNGLFDEGEVGVPSARVYLEDGTFTLTDVVGKYHIDGVRPGLHVLKTDPSTLPDGLGSFASWSRSAGGAGTQFVDVGDNQLFKSNVATGGWGISVARLLIKGLYRERRESVAPADRANPANDEGLREVVFPPLLASAVFQPESAEMTRAARTVVEGYASLIREHGGKLVTILAEPAFYPLADEGLMRVRAERFAAEMSRLVLASAPENKEAPRAADSSGSPGPQRPAPSPGAAPEITVAPASSHPMHPMPPEMTDLEARVRQMSPEPELLAPADGAIVVAERVNVEAKLPAGLEPRLEVNGQVIANDSIAVRMETSLTHLVFYRYLGVPFSEGKNSLVIKGLDQWGNERAWVERTINRVGQPRHVALHPDDASLRADSRTPIDVKIEVRDSLGLPVADGTLVTVEASDGEFIGADAAPQQEGFQAATIGGIATAHLTPASRAGQRTVTARAGEASGESSFSLTPDLRNWIVAGVGEATIGQKGISDESKFSDALGDPAADARLALFARGRLFGTSLMTLSYDSQRERDRDQLFRGLAPDRFYPIYGDSSEQRYEVEGQGKFSLRLDQPRSSLTLGDFTTALSGGDLLRYDRALTGATGRVELHGLSLQSFGATTPQTQIRDELPGAGISGPYRLTRRPVVVNSERVVLETRDRYHPERLISTRAMSRFSDYDIDYEQGGIIFKQPVSFQDDDFNPIVVVVLYETLDGNGEATVAGGRVGYRFGETAEIGTTYVNEGRDGGAFILRGADVTLKRSFTRGSFEFKGEAATSESAASNPAGAVSFRTSSRIGESVGLSAYYRTVSSGFDNPSRAGLSDTGTVRWGVEGSAALSDKSHLKGEVFSQTDSLHGQDRRVGSIDWEKPIGRFTARSGFKDLSALDPQSGETESSRLLSAGLGMRFNQRIEAQVGRQQVLSGAALQEYPTRTSLGLSTQITDDIRAFVREEYDQSDAGQASRTVVGMESRLTKNTVMESRYSLEDALNGSRGFAQLGLKTRLPMGQDWLGDASLERVETTRGLAAADFTSLGIGFEYLPAKVKFTTRYELRLGAQDDTHVLTAAGATRLTDALSLFSRQRLFFVVPDQGRARFDGDGLIGFACRPVSNDRLNFLVKLQGLKGSGGGIGASPEARSYLGTFETNYQPAARLHLLGRLAFKESLDQLEGDSFTSQQRLTEARAMYDISERFSAGVSGRLLDQDSIGSRLSGYGVEGGYRLAKDLWMVTGYNLTGFTATGFGDTERRAEGPFLTIRFKFDEESLVGLSQSLTRVRQGS